MKEALGDDIPEVIVEKLFVETEQYSERVIDIGLWHPPVLPWIKLTPNHWLPEKFGILIKDRYVQLSTDDVAALRQLIATAMQTGNRSYPSRATPSRRPKARSTRSPR